MLTVELCLSYYQLLVSLFEGHTAKVFRVKWCPLREGILVSGSDDKLVFLLCFYTDACPMWAPVDIQVSVLAVFLY